MEDQALHVALYARVSSEQQVQDATILSQVASLRARIAEDGCTLKEELCFLDEGYSGSTLIRPGLERLRDMAAAGCVDRLYVHSPDRLARKYAYQVLLIDELRRWGTEVVFLNRALGTTPEEDLLLQVQGVIAEYERAKMMERSRRGKRHAARAGSVSVLAGAPYGYDYFHKRRGGGEAAWQINAEQAAVVQQIFTWVGRDRVSLREVARRLRQREIPTPRGKSLWRQSTLSEMLRNPAYVGEARYGRRRSAPRRTPLRPQRGHAEHPRRASRQIPAPLEEQVVIAVPAIVSHDVFAAVAEQLPENGRRHRGASQTNLLSGLVVCKQCGYAYVGSGAKSHRYYRCMGTSADQCGQRICDNRFVHADALEEAVWQDISALLLNPQRLREEYQRRLKPNDHNDPPRRRHHETQVAKLRQGIARLIDAYEDGLLEKAQFASRLERSQQRLKQLESELQTYLEEKREQDELQLIVGCLEDFAQQARQGIQTADFSMRQEIIRTLVKRIEIEPDHVRLIYRVTPTRPFDQGPIRGRLQDCPLREQGPNKAPNKAPNMLI
jgi:site-specific DNA recombinase